MIGYNNLTHFDWTHYFEGGVCFNRAENGMVAAYNIDYLTDYCPEEEYDEDGQPLHEGNSETFVDADHSCLLTLASRVGEAVLGRRDVALRDLFTKPEWVVHRFQLGYVPMTGTELAFIGMEPTSSRMFKSLNVRNLYTHGILSGKDAKGAHVPVSSLEQIQRGLTMGRHIRSSRWPALWSGVCKVLEYGKSNVFHNPTKVSTVDLVRVMLHTPIAEREENVICPDFTTAIIGHRHITNVAYVVTNGSIIGTLRLEMGVLTLYSDSTRYPDRQARKLAKKALEDKARRLYADQVTWEH